MRGILCHYTDVRVSECVASLPVQRHDSLRKASMKNPPYEASVPRDLLLHIFITQHALSDANNVYSVLRTNGYM